MYGTRVERCCFRETVEKRSRGRNGKEKRTNVVFLYCLLLSKRTRNEKYRSRYGARRWVISVFLTWAAVTLRVDR